MTLDSIKPAFKGHILTEVLNTPHIKVFDFKRPDSGEMYQRWIVDRGTLIVQGDCWNAIYKWNNKWYSQNPVFRSTLGRSM